MAAIGILSASTILPFLNMYDGVPIQMIAIWRYQITVIYCIPISIFVWKKNKHLINYKEAFTWKTLSEIILGASFFTFGSFFLVYSSKYTLFSHAIVLANTGGVFIISLNLIYGIIVHRIEIIGIIVILLGVIVLILGKFVQQKVFKQPFIS